RYFLGADGLSLPLLVLTTLLSLLAIIASFHIQERVKEYFFFFLLLETAMLGVFIALDLFLFYVFWELTLVPMYFLIGIWGGPKRLFAAGKFFLYTITGRVVILVGHLTLLFFCGSGGGNDGRPLRFLQVVQEPGPGHPPPWP